jgi:hypothetical protein
MVGTVYIPRESKPFMTSGLPNRTAYHRTSTELFGMSSEFIVFQDIRTKSLYGEPQGLRCVINESLRLAL